MDWTYLGHASWHVRARALRLLFDPVLDDPHHGGTYAVWPARRIHAEALRPDFLFVSHAHTDHFDVRSLRRLALLDPDTVVVTPDPLVEHVATRVGFSSVRRIAAGTAIELDDGVRVVATPSRATEPEWGAIVETSDGAVWNQVDTVLADVDEVRQVVAGACLGPEGLALTLARWAPLLEIEAQVPGSLAFPHLLYDTILDLVAATGSRVVVPSAAGQRHVGPAAWLDHISLPISERRFLADLAVRAPTIRALPSRVGATYVLRAGEVKVHDEGGEALVERIDDDRADPRRFRPWEVPPLRDTTPSRDAPALEERLDRWVREMLAPALAHSLGDLAVASGDPIRTLLSVVFPAGPREWTMTTRGERCEVVDGDPGNHDVANAVSAAALGAVIDGTRAWGDILLAGELRASAPAFRVRERGLHRLAIAPIFLYYALPYAESCQRAVLAELEAVLRGEPPPWLSRPAL